MDLAELERRIGFLEAGRGDDEGAHAEEDRIHVDVLRAIRDGYPNPVELADRALDTLDIEFCRWYA